MTEIRFLVSQSTGIVGIGDVKEGQIIRVDNSAACIFVERGIAVYLTKDFSPIHQRELEEANSLVNKPAINERRKRNKWKKTKRYSLDEY